MADKSKIGESYYMPPPKLGKWEGFKLFLWNSETSQFLGRTGSSWAKILLFYIIFYAALSGFFGAMMAVFFQTLLPGEPKWKLTQSLIGDNPGLGFRPMPPESNVESTLIWFDTKKPDNMDYWVEAIDSFLQTYKPTDMNKKSDKEVICNGHENVNKKGQYCAVQLSGFGPSCNAEKHYGYRDGSPCIFLKLNKIFDWEPIFYKNETDIPDHMPEELKRKIRASWTHSDKREHEKIWVTCAGENPADQENIGAVNIYPTLGFPAYYFPYTNVEGYLPPLVAVQFSKPKKGVLINIECKAWAKNIEHDRAERRGSVHFELMID